MLRDLLHLVTARADALLEHVPGALDGDVRSTHQARVAARRLAEVLAMTGEFGRRLRREVRGLRRGLGATRELDVARHLADAEARRHRWPAPAMDRLRRYLDRERARRLTDAERTLRHITVSGLRKRIRAVGADAAEVPLGAFASRVRARIRARERALALAVSHAGAIYDVERLHDVRIAVKKLRYSLEIARDAGLGRPVRRIAALKAEQRVLGDLHDAQLLEGHVRALDAQLESSRGAVATALRAIRDRLDADCRRLHAEWLRRASRRTRR